MSKKIFILLGHPDKETRSGSFADAYEAGAKAAGHEVRRKNLGDLQFDPILHKGYKVIQPLEPDLIALEEDIRWCEHFVLFYPTWWSSMPALLKGLFDRLWIPGFAFHFKSKGFMAGMLWDKMLRGRSARVFVMSDSQPIFARLLFGDSTNEIRKCILWFAGFRARVKKVGPLKHADDARLAKWRGSFVNWGKRGY